jgi:hypothetical protein
MDHPIADNDVYQGSLSDGAQWRQDVDELWSAVRAGKVNADAEILRLWEIVGAAQAMIPGAQSDA